MLLRQVQARALQGHHLRALRRRGHSRQGAPRAHGPHQARGAGEPHLVLQGRAVAHGLPARHRPQGAREGALLRRQLRHHLGRHRAPRQRSHDAAGEDRRDQGALRRLRRDALAGHPRHARRGHRDRRRRARGRRLPRRQRPRGRVRVLQLLRHLRVVPAHRRQRVGPRPGRAQAPAHQGRQAARRLHRPRLQERRARQGPDRQGLGAVQDHRPARRRQRRGALPADGAHVRPRARLRAGELRRVLHRRHRRRGRARAAQARRSRGRGGRAARDHPHRQGPAPGARRQAPQGRLGLPAQRQPPRVDDPRRRSR